MCALCQMFTGTPDIGERLWYAAYIDPGSGYVFSSIIPLVIGFLATVFGSSLFFLRRKIWPFVNKHWKLFLIIFVLLVLGTIAHIMQSNMRKKSTNRKIVILGFDGLDPKIVDQGFTDNLFPNLKALKEKGAYVNLQTTMPPQSPVAWASFATGVWPNKHGIFDFIERKPENYSLDLVFSNPARNPLQAKPFWQITAQQAIPTTVLFLPDTFPPTSFEGKMLAGMGTPDILGTEGTFTFFSSKNYSLDPKWRGRLVKISSADGVIKTTIEGPKYHILGETKATTIPLILQVNKKDKTVTIHIQNQDVVLREGTFSSWVKMEFRIDFFKKIRGIAKFYFKQASPDFELYLSPINIDPESPVFPISTPKDYAKDIAHRYGLYSTLGLPHDTWALEENIFDEDTFLKNADNIMREREKIILGELNQTSDGLFYGYFGITDTMQHMYWRFLNNPTSKYQKTILHYYQMIDEVAGQVLKTLHPNDALIILSDHGFDSFDYEMNVNTWLKENGYLFLTDGKSTGGELLKDIDWSKTVAYAVGYNGIYLNLQGREGEGIVSSDKMNDLEKEMKTKLLALENPYTHMPVIKKVYTRRDLQIATSANSPDLFLGFYKGIRASWDTAVGAVPDTVIKKRQTKWSGDHLFDPTEVPGILFTSFKLATDAARIVDVIPTALSLLQAKSTVNFDGRDLTR